MASAFVLERMVAREMLSLAGQNSRKYSRLGNTYIVQHIAHQLVCMKGHIMSMFL